MAMTKNSRSRGEGRNVLEAVAGAMTYASLEAQWLAESLSGSKVLINGQG